MRHQTISFIKSAMRIVGYAMCIFTYEPYVIFAAVTLIAAELVGIAEEIGHE